VRPGLIVLISLVATCIAARDGVRCAFGEGNLRARRTMRVCVVVNVEWKGSLSRIKLTWISLSPLVTTIIVVGDADDQCRRNDLAPSSLLHAPPPRLRSDIPSARPSASQANPIPCRGHGIALHCLLPSLVARPLNHTVASYLASNRVFLFLFSVSSSVCADLRQ
jgi:hypothetical protein